MFRCTFASVDSKELVSPECCKMQRVSQVLQTKDLGPTGVLQKIKTPAGMLALQDRGTMLPREYDMRISILCQGKKEWREVPANRPQLLYGIGVKLLRCFRVNEVPEVT